MIADRNNPPPIDIRFESDDRDYLLIEVLGFEIVKPTNYHDANWIRTRISAKAGVFRVKPFAASLFLGGFTTFTSELRSIYEKLHGTASLNTLDPWVQITATSDMLGHITMACIISDNFITDRSLKFDLTMDQTMLRSPLDQLDILILSYYTDLTHWE